MLTCFRQSHDFPVVKVKIFLDRKLIFLLLLSLLPLKFTPSSSPLFDSSREFSRIWAVQMTTSFFLMISVKEIFSWQSPLTLSTLYVDFSNGRNSAE